MLSHYWGYLHQKELPTWLRSPLLGLYVKAFGCNMAEAEIEQLTKYRNLCELFTRNLKPGMREICQSHELVSLLTTSENCIAIPRVILHVIILFAFY